jgi:hypothetical protein
MAKKMDYEEEKLDKYIFENCKEAINYEDFIKNIEITEEFLNGENAISRILQKEIKKYDKHKCPFYSTVNTKNQRVMKIKKKNVWKTYYYTDDVLTEKFKEISGPLKELTDPIIKKMNIWLSINKKLRNIEKCET